jgi:superfamily I DNA/RNA helicase
VLDQACAALKAAGVPVRITTGRETSSSEPSTVAVATMHRMKGLEYRYVCVIDAGKGRLPPPVAVTPEHDDPIAHQHDLQRERCLLYVACTRAREELRVSWSGPPSPFIEPLTR